MSALQPSNKTAKKANITLKNTFWFEIEAEAFSLPSAEVMMGWESVFIRVKCSFWAPAFSTHHPICQLERQGGVKTSTHFPSCFHLVSAPRPPMSFKLRSNSLLGEHQAMPKTAQYSKQLHQNTSSYLISFPAKYPNWSLQNFAAKWKQQKRHCVGAGEEREMQMCIVPSIFFSCFPEYQCRQSNFGNSTFISFFRLPQGYVNSNHLCSCL